MASSAQVRRRKSYRRFAEFYEYLEGDSSASDILYRVHGLMESLVGFGSKAASDEALESIRVVIEDYTKKNVWT
jgi:hypothetical protein